MNTPDPDAAAVADALRALWRTIHAEHPELPAAAPLQALERADGPADPLTRRYPRADDLAQGARATLAALLREAAHQLAEARGVSVTSNRGFYHNRRFAELAHEVGLQATTDTATGSGRGFSRIAVPEPTAARYATPLAQLHAALAQHPPTARAQRRSPDRSYVAAACRCGRRIRLSRAELTAGGIQCTHCGSDFTTEQARE